MMRVMRSCARCDSSVCMRLRLRLRLRMCVGSRGGMWIGGWE